jgi:hypothetical protein
MAERKFGLGKADIDAFLEQYLDGQPRVYSNHETSICGVLKKIDTATGFAHFQPAIVYNLDGSYAEINDQESVIISLPIRTIRPLLKGATLEEYVADYNERKNPGDEPSRVIIP